MDKNQNMVVKLQEEGFKDVDDLKMVDKDIPKQLTDKLNALVTRSMWVVKWLQLQMSNLLQSCR